MSKGSNVGGAIIGSVLISIILVAAGGYFGLPLIFPNINEDNIVLQSKMVQINNQAVLYDSEPSFELINGTQMSISIEEDSKIAINFASSFLLHVSNTMIGAVWYEISLVIEGVANITSPIEFYRGTTSAGYEEFTTQVSMNLLSNQLSSGTYNISVYWRSMRNIVGTNSLQTFMYDSISTKYYNYVRTIWAQELR